MPFTIELASVDNTLDRIIRGTIAYDDATIGEILSDVYLTVLNTSCLWSSLHVQAKCGEIILDSGLKESYVEIAEEGHQRTEYFKSSEVIQIHQIRQHYQSHQRLQLH